MTDIVEAIDDFILDRYIGYNLKQYGFCELMRKTAGEGGVEQVFPVTYSERDKVSIDDRYSLITWTRWAAPATYEPNEEWSFGKTEARMGTITLRLAFANKVTLGEDLVFDFVNALPSTLDVGGYQLVHLVGTPSIDPDHEGIWVTEFSNTAYEKHRFTWNFYVVNIVVQFIQCEQLTP